jgi:LacI family transcriptional regulator
LRETGGLGVLLPFVSGEFFSDFLAGIDRCTQENGYYLLISSSHRNRTEFEVALKSMYGRVDGLVIMAPGQSSFDSSNPILNQLPVVFVNTKVRRKDIDVFNFANFDGAFKVTAHLIEKGHRRLAAIKGPASANDAIERIRGFRAAIKRKGLPASAGVVIDGDFTQEAGFAAVSDILALEDRPTAVLAANDVCALGALSALRGSGVSVPAEMAVAGFDDIISARFSSPPLTTVRVPVYDLGMQAIQRLISKIREEDTVVEPEQTEMPVEVILRASTEGT